MKRLKTIRNVSVQYIGDEDEFIDFIIAVIKDKIVCGMQLSDNYTLSSEFSYIQIK